MNQSCWFEPKVVVCCDFIIAALIMYNAHTVPYSPLIPLPVKVKIHSI